MRGVWLLTFFVVGCGSTIPVGGSGNDMTSSGPDAGGGSNVPGTGQTDPLSDAGASGDGGGDGAVSLGDTPGATCTGTLTDAALVTLFATKPVLPVSPYLANLSIPEGARTLGSYTTALYKRACNSNTGCGSWAVAAQPTNESFQHPSIPDDPSLSQGKVEFWDVVGKAPRLMFVSRSRAPQYGSPCNIYTVGVGDLVRSGNDASMTLSPSLFSMQCFQNENQSEPRKYYEPTGIVTDHCLKLAYRKELNRIDIGPGAYTYDEYVIVYEATY